MTRFIHWRSLVAGLILGLLLVASLGKAHRLNAAPGLSTAQKLTVAKQQVAHDRAELAMLTSRHWSLLSPMPYVAWSHHYWLKRDVAYVARLQSELRPDVLAIICQVFGPYCAQAQRVALCEGGRPVPSVNATNGQYLGIFQMGSFARSTYGHGNDAWSQARAAYRYFVASGRDWSPWECKP